MFRMFNRNEIFLYYMRAKFPSIIRKKYVVLFLIERRYCPYIIRKNICYVFILVKITGAPKGTVFKSISIERPLRELLKMGAFGCSGAF